MCRACQRLNSLKPLCLRHQRSAATNMRSRDLQNAQRGLNTGLCGRANAEARVSAPKATKPHCKSSWRRVRSRMECPGVQSKEAPPAGAHQTSRPGPRSHPLGHSLSHRNAHRNAHLHSRGVYGPMKAPMFELYGIGVEEAFVSMKCSRPREVSHSSVSTVSLRSRFAAFE